MADNPQIQKTADGSCTLYLKAMDESYHSSHGAMAESQHIYISNGLESLKAKKNLNILEVGFGTGLNALLTMDNIPDKQQIMYYAIEPFPIDMRIIHEYYSQFERLPKSHSYIDKLQEVPFGELKAITPCFSFCFIHKTLQSLELDDVHKRKFDLVFYDAFAPSKQKDMWTHETIQKATELMSEGALLCTYCAQGQFKRTLKSLGLKVENPEGALGKREMTVGRKLGC